MAAQAGQIVHIIEPQQDVFIPVTPSPETHAHGEAPMMDDATFRAKYVDNDFWERYAKCPENKRKYFFIGKQVNIMFDKLCYRELDII